MTIIATASDRQSPLPTTFRHTKQIRDKPHLIQSCQDKKESPKTRTPCYGELISFPAERLFEYSRIALRSDCPQLLLHTLGHVERFDELGDRFPRNVCVGACKRLERFVRRRITRPAQHGLDTFGHDRPVVSKSQSSASRFRSSLLSPLSSDRRPMSEWAIGTPTLRNTVESVRSRCKRDKGSFEARCS